MVIVFTGSRNWKNRMAVMDELEELAHTSGNDKTLIRHGACRGLDMLVDECARELNRYFKEKNNYKPFKIKKFPVTKKEWKMLGKSAGPLRNMKMLEESKKYGKVKKVIAFHKNIRESKGTRDCVLQALEKGLDIKLVK